MKVHGRYHCGAIAYEAEVEPGTVNVCHCLDCQTLTGCAFRANIQAADSFHIIEGSPRRYTKAADSGARRSCVLRQLRSASLFVRARKSENLLPSGRRVR